MPVITISRTTGSEGAVIGKALAKRLNYRYFDRAELSKIARKHRYLRADLRVMDEKAVSLFDILFRDKPKEFISFLHDTICDVADGDNVVIIGRGGQAILRDLPTAFHVRVDAPLKVRAKRIMERLRMSEAAAIKWVKEMDKERGLFVRQAFGAEWAEPQNYHLVVNAGIVDVPTATKMILQAFRQVPWKERQLNAKGVLKRYRLSRAIRTALTRDSQITCPTCVDLQLDDQGVVTLVGRLPEPRERSLIENAVRRVKGVTRVVNKLRP
jgi:cytidylate kinase